MTPGQAAMFMTDNVLFNSQFIWLSPLPFPHLTPKGFPTSPSVKFSRFKHQGVKAVQ